MISRLLLLFLLIATMTGACRTTQESRVSSPDATSSDMLNILDDDVARPFSRYMYKVTAAGGQEAVSGMVVMDASDNDPINLNLIAAEKNLKIIANESFLRSYELTIAGTDIVPLGGGYAARGRLAIIPGVYKPRELRPSWFPAQADISVDKACKFLLNINKSGASEAQKLVEYMDAQKKMEGTQCEIIGRFDTIPQLKRIVASLKKESRHHPGRLYVFRLSGTDTFALVEINRRGDAP